MADPVTEATTRWTTALHGWLGDRFYDGDLSNIGGMALVIVGTVVLVLLVHLIFRLVIVAVIRHVVRRTPTKWDDCLVEEHFFTRIAHLAPASMVYFSARFYTPPFFEWSAEEAVQKIAITYIILTGVFAVNAALNAMVAIYETLKMSRQNPIKGFVGGGKIVVWLVGGVFIVAEITNRDPWGVVAGIGALMAVVLLVFKDTILGLVASIQIFVNDLVNIGDWIEMPKYGADGDVIDITLTTIKVQNWDKTITTIPSYALIVDSFKNWRGMQESGGRRIKRSIVIDMSTIKFCTEEMLERFSKFKLLGDYIQAKQEEIGRHNAEHQVDSSRLIDGRHLTNVGTFRAYLKAFLASNPKIHQGMTFLVRQLAPTDRGLPIEIYVFCNDTAWANYEDIQADIFDHILAVIPDFDLAVFQTPTGRDFHQLVTTA